MKPEVIFRFNEELEAAEQIQINFVYKIIKNRILKANQIKMHLYI